MKNKLGVFIQKIYNRIPKQQWKSGTKKGRIIKTNTPPLTGMEVCHSMFENKRAKQTMVYQFCEDVSKLLWRRNGH